ncbi:hypothetical protein HYDPIDRAFT_26718 [Hydnomerulius pinastri MD-312]|nr:hypothetical protein HYDPIDRAFT_26718 [Hydnomerulius pinastri MD-312]
MSRTADPIVTLNNFLQSIGRTSALSWKDAQRGPAHTPEWRSVCKISGKEYGVGTGTHRHLARGAAAVIALAALQAENEAG